jgi:hypothetical protein
MNEVQTWTPANDPALPEGVLQMAADLQLDTLLECPHTADATIRFICSARKYLLEAPEVINDPEVTEAERLLSRIYHHIGYDRRNLAFRRQAQ